MKVTSTRNRVTIVASKAESYLIRTALLRFCDLMQDTTTLSENLAAMGYQIPHEPPAFEVAAWPALNRERGLLIDKDIAGTITPEERKRLEQLQAYADNYLEAVAPREFPVIA